MWVYGSGFPKSHNIGKAIQKQSGDVKVIGTKQGAGTTGKSYISNNEDYVDGDKGVFKKEYDEIEINNEWEGWGTALKPAHEPIVMARKPLSEKSIAENVLKHGTGGINIDGSRIPFEDTQNAATNPKFRKENNYKMPEPGQESNGAVKFTSSKNEYDTSGRFPANIIFDEEAGQLLDEQSGNIKGGKSMPPFQGKPKNHINFTSGVKEINRIGYNDKGGASRFFYCPKTAKSDRDEGLDNFEEKAQRVTSGGTRDFNARCANCGKKFIGSPTTICDCDNPVTDNQVFKKKNNHPTVKPTDLMRYLINLVTPPNGTILDPFMGSGSTGKAAVRCGVNFIGIEKEQEYMDIASARIEHERNKPTQQKLF
jgi:site-specific DNA-methyltransferase (adenine-specific)